MEPLFSFTGNENAGDKATIVGGASNRVFTARDAATVSGGKECLAKVGVVVRHTQQLRNLTRWFECLQRGHTQL